MVAGGQGYGHAKVKHVQSAAKQATLVRIMRPAKPLRVSSKGQPQVVVALRQTSQTRRVSPKHMPDIRKQVQCKPPEWLVGGERAKHSLLLTSRKLVLLARGSLSRLFRVTVTLLN